MLECSAIWFTGLRYQGGHYCTLGKPKMTTLRQEPQRFRDFFVVKSLFCGLIGIPQPIVIIPKIIILQLIINQKGFCSHCSSAELHMRRCQNTSFSACHGFHGPDSGLFAWLSMDWFKGKSTGNHGFYYKI